MRAPAFTALVLTALAAAAPPALAQDGDIIVRFKPGVTTRERADARADAQVALVENLAVSRAQVVDPRPGQSVREAIAELERDPAVAYAEPNGTVRAFRLPNDALLPDLWALRNTGQVAEGLPGVPGADIDAGVAWDVTRGSSDVLVAIVDTGIDEVHPDLTQNV